MKTKFCILPALVCAISSTLFADDAAPANRPDGYTNTPLLPGGKWHVHDPNRPQPVVITPGTFSTPEKPGTPPSDAIILFDGKDTSKWTDSKGEPSAWIVKDGYMEVPPRGTKGGGDIKTLEKFGDIQLHLEWSEPVPPKGRGQGRGNSGIFFMDRFELQVLDCYENQTYPDGQTAALYGMLPPMVNACRKPGEWQTYDVTFTAPRFSADGKLEQPAYITAFHNGVAVQNHSAYLGPSGHKNLANYNLPVPPKDVIHLQDHGDPVRYRNIWVRELKAPQ